MCIFHFFPHEYFFCFRQHRTLWEKAFQNATAPKGKLVFSNASWFLLTIYPLYIIILTLYIAHFHKRAHCSSQKYCFWPFWNFVNLLFNETLCELLPLTHLSNMSNFRLDSSPGRNKANVTTVNANRKSYMGSPVTKSHLPLWPWHVMFQVT